MLGPQQLSMVRQFVNEGMQSRFRSVPESFGENPISNAGVHSGERFAQSETMGPSLPLSGGYDAGGYVAVHLKMCFRSQRSGLVIHRWLTRVLGRVEKQKLLDGSTTPVS